VLRRTDQGGGYVTRPGTPASYTKNKAEARQYATREAAEVDRCPDNEAIERATP